MSTFVDVLWMAFFAFSATILFMSALGLTVLSVLGIGKSFMVMYHRSIFLGAGVFLVSMLLLLLSFACLYGSQTSACFAGWVEKAPNGMECHWTE